MNLQSVSKMVSECETYFQVKETTSVFEEYPVIGAGSGRIVIDNGETVYKVSIGEGVEQNKNEVVVWDCLLNRCGVKNAQTLVSPINSFSLDYRWVEMCKVDVLEETFGSETFQSLQLKSQLADYGVYIEDVGIGLYNGEEVAFDYGQIVKIDSYMAGGGTGDAV